LGKVLKSRGLTTYREEPVTVQKLVDEIAKMFIRSGIEVNFVKKWLNSDLESNRGDITV